MLFMDRCNICCTSFSTVVSFVLLSDHMGAISMVFPSAQHVPARGRTVAQNRSALCSMLCKRKTLRPCETGEPETLSALQVPEVDDEIGFEAANALASATGGGKTLLATVQWRSRPVPGTRDTPPVPATAHVVLRPKPAEGAASGGNAESINEQLLRAGLARLEKALGYQVIGTTANGKWRIRYLKALDKNK